MGLVSFSEDNEDRRNSDQHASEAGKPCTEAPGSWRPPVPAVPALRSDARRQSAPSSADLAAALRAENVRWQGLARILEIDNVRLLRTIDALEGEREHLVAEVEYLRAECRPVRFLVTGARQWRDPRAVQAMLEFAVDRYGGPTGATLLTFGGEGVEAIARRTWRAWQDATAGQRILVPQWQRDGHEAQLVRFERALKDGGITAVLAFLATRGDGRSRRVVRRARILGVPVWRWSVSLGRPVPGGVDVHSAAWRKELVDNG